MNRYIPYSEAIERVRQGKPTGVVIYPGKQAYEVLEIIDPTETSVLIKRADLPEYPMSLRPEYLKWVAFEE